MTEEYCKEQMKKLEELAKLHPEKRVIYRLQYKCLKCALDLYYRDHPQSQFPALDR